MAFPCVQRLNKALKGKPELHFLVGQETLELMDEFKQVFAVKTNAAVIKRLMALGQIACAHKFDDGTIKLIGSGPLLTIQLNR